MALSKNIIQIIFNLLSGKLTSERFLLLKNKDLDILIDIFIFGRIENRLLDTITFEPWTLNLKHWTPKVVISTEAKRNGEI